MTTNTRRKQKNSINEDLKNFTAGIHYNIDLESAILGACMLNKHAYGRVRGILNRDIFYSKPNKLVWDAITDLWAIGWAVDDLTVVHKIFTSGLQDQFPTSVPYYVTNLTKSVVSDANIEAHSLICRQLYIKRMLLEIQSNAGAGIDDPLAKLEEIQKSIKDAQEVSTGDDWQDLSNVMVKLSHRIDVMEPIEFSGIPLGFPTMDKVCGGFEGGELIIIGARPSVGKTAFAADFVLNAAAKGFGIGLINLEMPDIQLGARILSKYADIDFWRIWRAKFASDEQRSTLYSRMGDLANLPIHISDKTKVTSSDIRAKAVKLKNRTNLDALVIDYLQLMESEGGSGTREQEVSKISRGLKLLAMELNIPVIALAQLSRESEKSVDKRPKMSNLRESGALEQDADRVILLHRDFKSGITVDQYGESTENKAQIIWDKNRNGVCTTFDVNFDPKTIRFYE